MRSIIQFFRKYNELILGPIGLVIWFLSPTLIRFFDPVAATYDNAVWQKVIFGMVLFNICTFNTWIALRLTFPGIFKYLVELFDQDFVNLNDNQKWEKLKVSFSFLALYLLGLILCMQVL